MVIPEEHNLRFPGQYHDRLTGLYYNMFRYYRPDLGRYLTPDPIGLAGGTNLYGYAGQNPINYTDPMGLYSWGEFWGDVEDFGHQTAQLAIGFGDRVSNNNTRHLRGTDYYTNVNSFGYRTGQNAGDIVIVGLGVRALFALVGELTSTTVVAEACETVTASQIPEQITGFTKHGIDQVIERGVSPEVLRYTIQMGDYSTKIDQYGRTAIEYVSDKAVVVLNEAGVVVTAWRR